ncbi:porin [sulfur-oxidizing endosymbiont of Gigantopelta aegis]|uniref:porin n=1 Tax=sulfur-oxidizing endosymbiont of Gigantopelta aegis TaxID=2794934 RepID=UPI001BE45FC2|nr:porin [sulfur-oxidizing endosymbiont of Gigantopelta aegis]
MSKYGCFYTKISTLLFIGLAKVWGFLQPQYERVENDKLAAGAWKGQDAAFNSIGPNLDSNSQFQLRRARIGIRGAGFPLDDKINYFILAEFGKNGITEYGSAVELTDASVTFNHIKGARVRVGQFKTPMSEEVYQGIALFDWINFTSYANQQLLERHFDVDGQLACIDGLTAGNSSYQSTCKSGNEWTAFGAARDTGIQVFDTFVFDGMEDWEFSYSGMVGNGTGLNQGDYNNNKDYYLYFSAEQVYTGKRARRDGWKTFAWYTKGTREILTSTNNGKGNPASYVEDEFDRKRWGIGTTYRKGKIRASAEYNKAKGMIFNGTTGGTIPGNVGKAPNGAPIAAGFNILTDEEADGWYLDFGYKVLPKLELAARFDRYNRGTDGSVNTNNGGGNERRFDTWTLGAQYFFNKKTRATVNYAFRDAKAYDNNTADDIINDFGDILSFQVTAIF